MEFKPMMLQVKDKLGNWLPIPALIGPKGEKGPKGDKGDPGKDAPPIVVDAELSDISTNPVENQAVTKALASKADKEGEWELIERYCIGYETLQEKPADWETNWQNYYVPEYSFNYALRKLPVYMKWEPNTFFRKLETAKSFQKFTRTEEPDGTPYRFTCIALFIHDPFLTTAINNEFITTRLDSGEAFAVYNIKNKGSSRFHTFSQTITEYGRMNTIGGSCNQGGKTLLTSTGNPGSFSNMSKGVINEINSYWYPSKDYEAETLFEIFGVRA